tara:strand:- start:114 stop:272 length:159 start_codon:yes stop_codon:yes gene_type:complete
VLVVEAAEEEEEVPTALTERGEMNERAALATLRPLDTDGELVASFFMLAALK